MRNIARLSDNDRRELFRNTADKMGLNDAIVEKDFWVCFTLDYLFHRSPWKESITFKGGTSLSKAFHLISRFSEDIDLILDWRVLGYGKDEPWEKRSNTKQDAFNKEANVRAEVFLSETFCPAVKAGLSQEIGCEANVYIDEKDKQTVIFAYPHLFTNTATLQVIRLEIGALAAWTPAKTALIEPYAAKYYPKIFEQKEPRLHSLYRPQHGLHAHRRFQHGGIAGHPAQYAPEQAGLQEKQPSVPVALRRHPAAVQGGHHGQSRPLLFPNPVISPFTVPFAFHEPALLF